MCSFGEPLYTVLTNLKINLTLLSFHTEVQTMINKHTVLIVTKRPPLPLGGFVKAINPLTKNKCFCDQGLAGERGKQEYMIHTQDAFH